MFDCRIGLLPLQSVCKLSSYGLKIMFEQNNNRSILLMCAQCVLLKGTLLIQLKQLLQLVAAVRIPGGLTPP